MVPFIDSHKFSFQTVFTVQERTKLFMPITYSVKMKDTLLPFRMQLSRNSSTGNFVDFVNQLTRLQDGFKILLFLCLWTT